MSSCILRQTPLTCSGHTRPVTFLSFSGLVSKEVPLGGETSNGPFYYCVSSCKDGKPMLRQGETGDWIGTFEGHKGAVWGVDINGDGTKVASGSADFSAKIWDGLKGQEILSLKHNHIVKSVHFSKDSKNLATGSFDKKLRIWDLEKGERAETNDKEGGPTSKDPLLTFQGHTSGIKQVLYNGDNTKLFSAGDDKTLRVWDVKSGSEIHKISLNESPGGMELHGSGDILTVAHGKNMTFYNAETFSSIKSITLPTIMYSASLSPDKKYVVCGGEDFIVYKYNYETGEELDNFKGHFGPVHCVRFSPDGELYASGSEDGTLRLWQNEVGKTYGLWKCVDSVTGAELPQMKSEAVA